MTDMPHNLELEQALLGALMQNNDQVHQVSGLMPEHFYERLHGDIYAKITERVMAGTDAIPATLRDHFSFDVRFNECGGIEYLTRMRADAVPGSPVGDYADTLVDLYFRRRVIEAAQIAQSDAEDPAVRSGLDVADELAQAVGNLALDTLRAHGMVEAGGLVSDTVDYMEAVHKDPAIALGAMCGIKTLDDVLKGFHAQDLLLIGGRPSMGKSTLGSTIGQGIAENGVGCAVYSLEMSEEQWTSRMITATASRSGAPIKYSAARSGGLTDDEMIRLFAVPEHFKDLPLYIDDGGGQSVGKIIRSIIRLKRKLEREGKSLGVVIIDQLSQIVAPTQYAGQKVNEIGQISQQLKAAAKQLNLCIVLLHQLSRGVEGRENKRPQLSDLRDSGALEQDADVVLFVYREAYYLEREEPALNSHDHATWAVECDLLRNTLEVLVSKQRMGPTGTFHLHCDVASALICDRGSDFIYRGGHARQSI